MPELLKRGSKGFFVGELIELLKAQGFYESILNSDWRFTVGVEDAVIYFQQTHLGPDGEPLEVDGIVGPDTWWALKHPTGKAQKSNLLPLIPRGLSGDRLKVLEIAVGEHLKGVKERPNGSNRGKEIDKYFPTWWLEKNKTSRHLAKGLPWCCYFVSWVFKEALGEYPTGKIEGSCSRFAQTALLKDGWWLYAEDVDSILMIWPGDVFVILHPKKPGKPQTGHTGFVLRTNKDLTLINTIEGNCGNRVKCGLRKVSDITGFITPYEDNGAEGGFVSSRTLLRAKSVAKDGTR